MSSHDATCPECHALLRETGPTGDPWETQIQCPGCSSIYHVSCTRVGTEKLWQRLGKYQKMWKCSRCFIPGSKESVFFYERITELEKNKDKGNSIIVKNSLDSEKSKGISCAECFEELRDPGGRLVRRVQCPDCCDSFHFYCTDIGDEDVWRKLGNYRTFWRCKQCFGFNTNSELVKEKIKTIKMIEELPIAGPFS